MESKTSREDLDMQIQLLRNTHEMFRITQNLIQSQSLFIINLCLEKYYEKAQEIVQRYFRNIICTLNLIWMLTEFVINNLQVADLKEFTNIMIINSKKSYIN